MTLSINKAIWDSVDADKNVDPAIAFLGGFGISRRALDLATRLAATRGTAAHDELIAAGILNSDDYWAYLADDLGVPFVTANETLAMSPAARFVPSEALRRADRLMVMDGAVPVLLTAPAGAMLSRLRDSVEGAPQIAHRIRIAVPETIRSLLLRRQAGRYAEYAVQRLRRASVASSAFGRPGPVITSIMNHRNYTIRFLMLRTITSFLRSIYRENSIFRIGFICIHFIVITGIIAVTYYTTRLPVGTLATYEVPTQAQKQHQNAE